MGSFASSEKEKKMIFVYECVCANVCMFKNVQVSVCTCVQCTGGLGRENNNGVLFSCSPLIF